MADIHFYLPDFYLKRNTNLFLFRLMNENPEVFNDNIDIGAVYGSFPGSIWNGGRVCPGICSKDEIQETLYSFNERNIPCRFTFTNPLLEEKHLYDTYCNLILEIGNNGLNEVIVNSPSLEAYIRKNYPMYKIISSTTKCLSTVNEVENEWKKDYYLIVLDNAFNNNWEKLELLPKKNQYEFVANPYCRDECPTRKEHYEAIGRAQLTYSHCDFKECQSINRNFFDLRRNKAFISIEDILSTYHEAGFCHYKLDGRGFHKYKVLESYMYYLTKPSRRDEVRLAMLKAMDRFYE